jgi:pimeloyl-ACP methyl ester carboxylesterase
MGGPIAQLLWHRHPQKVSGLVFIATSNRFVPGVRERLMFVTAVSAVAGSTRVGQLATRIPVAAFQRQVPPAVRARPDSFRSWASAEMRRHDARQVAEALAAVTNFDSRSWLNTVDVPTTIMVTTHDKAVPAQEQLRLLLAIPHATVDQYDEGHTWCAKPSFGPAVAAACRKLAASS